MDAQPNTFTKIKTSICRITLSKYVVYKLYLNKTDKT